MRKISLAAKLASFQQHWSPKIVGELNGQHVKLVKFQGDFVWHHHDTEDEMFLVVHGAFRMDYRDESGHHQQMEISEGEFVIVPRGTEHRPCATQEAHVLLFEPVTTRNTGNIKSDRTIESPELI